MLARAMTLPFFATSYAVTLRRPPTTVSGAPPAVETRTAFARRHLPRRRRSICHRATNAVEQHCDPDSCVSTFALAAARRNNRERMDRIFNLLRIAAVNISDRFSIRTPRRRTFPVRVAISFGRSRELTLLSARLLRRSSRHPNFRRDRDRCHASSQRRSRFRLGRPRRQHIVVCYRK